MNEQNLKKHVFKMLNAFGLWLLIINVQIKIFIYYWSDKNILPWYVQMLVNQLVELPTIVHVLQNTNCW